MNNKNPLYLIEHYKVNYKPIFKNVIDKTTNNFGRVSNKIARRLPKIDPSGIFYTRLAKDSSTTYKNFGEQIARVLRRDANILGIQPKDIKKLAIEIEQLQKIITQGPAQNQKKYIKANLRLRNLKQRFGDKGIAKIKQSYERYKKWLDNGDINHSSSEHFIFRPFKYSTIELHHPDSYGPDGAAQRKISDLRFHIKLNNLFDKYLPLLRK